MVGDRTPVAADLPRLTYANMVLQEAMRLYPPVWVIPRDAIDDDRDRRLPDSCRLHDPAQPLSHASSSRRLGEPRGVRSRPLRAGAVQGPSAPRVLPVRRRPAPVHGRRHGDDGDAADHGDGRAALPSARSSPDIAKRSSASSTCCRGTACARRCAASGRSPSSTDCRRALRSRSACPFAAAYARLRLTAFAPHPRSVDLNEPLEAGDRSSPPVDRRQPRTR